MKRSIRRLLAATEPLPHVLVNAWVRTRRDAKGFFFLELNDGSSLANLQAVVEPEAHGFELGKDIHTGAAVTVSGDLVASPAKGQAFELKVRRLELVGAAPEDYPLQKKRHSEEFLREIAHLRPRSNKFGAMLRIRSEAAFAVHDFFRSRAFVYVHTPILTGLDCEGAGEMFRVSPPGQSATDFFGREANLTVSGQLEGEILAQALSKVYTFGPTFRAENSNTARHAAEFWMIEPEAAFMDLPGDMELAESFVKAVLAQLLDRCAADLELFHKFVKPGLLDDLARLVHTPFARLSYTEAVAVLKSSGRDFAYPVEWGADLQTEHERFLAEEHLNGPVIVHDYPKSIKPFYMLVNDDEKTVAAMDVLVPGVGEIIGGSAREHRLPVLEDRMRDQNMPLEPYWWYRDLRRFGSTPHAGFGLGFERLLMLATGVPNIRDVIPFPRTPGSLEF